MSFIKNPTTVFLSKDRDVPEKIYTNRAKRILTRSFTNDSINLDIYREYFIIKSNSPSRGIMEYDISVTDNTKPLTIEIYINQEMVFTEVLNLQIGDNHLIHNFLFQIPQTNGYIYVKFFSLNPLRKTISNIKYELVGDNVVFLRDNPETLFYLYSCNKDYYLYKKGNKTLFFKTLLYGNNDFSENFEVMAQQSDKYEYWPLFSATKDDQNKCSIFNKASYGRRSAETDKFEIMDNVTNVINISLPNNIEGNKIEYADSGAFMMNGYGTVALYGICPEYSKGVSFNLNRTLVSSINNYYNRFKFKVVNISLVYNTRTAIGYTDYYGTMVFQNEFGEWFLNSKSKINSKDGVNIGFGTRVNLSLVSPFIDHPDREFSYRIFMYVYDHWVAKYVIMISSNKYEIVKTREIPGDFDQIISGTSNEYFTIKDGRFEKHIDDYIPPIEDFMK